MISFVNKVLLRLNFLNLECVFIFVKYFFLLVLIINGFVNFIILWLNVGISKVFLFFIFLICMVIVFFYIGFFKLFNNFINLWFFLIL